MSRNITFFCFKYMKKYGKQFVFELNCVCVKLQNETLSTNDILRVGVSRLAKANLGV